MVKKKILIIHNRGINFVDYEVINFLDNSERLAERKNPFTQVDTILGNTFRFMDKKELTFNSVRGCNYSAVILYDDVEIDMNIIMPLKATDCLILRKI